MNDEEYGGLAPGVLFTESKERELRAWIEDYYPEQLSEGDLVNFALHERVGVAFDRLEEIVGFEIL